MKRTKRTARSLDERNEESRDFLDQPAPPSDDFDTDEWTEDDFTFSPTAPEETEEIDLDDEEPNEEETRDLFADDWQEQSQQAPRSKKKKQNHFLGYMLLILALVLTSLLGILYLSMESPTVSNALEDLRAKEQQQYDDYTAWVNEQVKPESWDQAAFDQIKSQALAAYDTSRLDQIDLALGGDATAVEALQGVETASDQPGIESWKALLSGQQNIPAEVMALLGKGDPAYVSFVVDYPARSQEAIVEAPLSASLDTIPDLKTYDPLWGYMPYGNSVFADTGSAPTAISEVFSYLLKDPNLSPVTIGNWAKEYGYDLNPISESGDSIFSGAALTWGVNLNPISPYQTLISDALSYGQPVILALGPTEAPSFVVLTGLDENGNWIVQNPASSQAPSAVNPDDMIDQVVAAYSFF